MIILNKIIRESAFLRGCLKRVLKEIMGRTMQIYEGEHSDRRCIQCKGSEVATYFPLPERTRTERVEQGEKGRRVEYELRVVGCVSIIQGLKYNHLKKMTFIVSEMGSSWWILSSRY